MALSVPFSVADQAVLLREATGDPWNTVLQVATNTSIDVDRFRAAVIAACMRHPMARAYSAKDPLKEASPRWTIAESIDIDPVEVRECEDDAALTRFRQDLVFHRFSLRTAPPVRGYVVRQPGRPDTIALINCHVAMDGLSIVRLATSVARAYRGLPDPPDPVDFEATRRFIGPSEPAGPSTDAHMSRAQWAAHLLRQLRQPPVRVASVPPAGGATYGFAHHRLDADQVGAIVRAKPAGTSLNDVSVAALHLAIDRWNSQLGAPNDRIGINVPVSTRPPAWGGVVGNFISSRMIITRPGDRADLATAAASVVEQLAPWRESVRSGRAVASVPAGGGLPLPLKRALPKVMSRLAGSRVKPTSELVTCGRLPDDLRFDDATPHEAWIYPLCDPGVGVGALTLSVGEAMCVAVRFHRTRLSPEAGDRFAALLVATLVDG